jgi:signal peptidase I
MTKKNSAATPQGEASSSVKREQRGRGDDRPDSSSDGLRSYVSPEAIREVIESVVIAFVLAFLFRTFEAEAFVIPTGSMAPTLMGRHKDLVCDECGMPFQVGASDEVNAESNELTQVRVVGGTCPNCRHRVEFAPDDEKFPSYGGDRILVGKFAYEIAEPKRWDVAVFHYPGDAKTNFIKRLVGLPNETLRITHGRLWVRHEGQQEFSIARKPPQKILATLQPVYDNDYLARPIRDGVWQSRWASQTADPGIGQGDWVASPDRLAFHTEGGGSAPVWLQYRNLIPSDDDWTQYLATGTAAGPTRPQLITDMTAYDSEIRYDFGEKSKRSAYYPINWVGDLSVSCQLRVQKPGGEAILELVRGGRVFQCRLDLENGQAALSISGLKAFHPTAETSVRGPGTYQLRLANVEGQLTVWVNGSVVAFHAAPGSQGAQDGDSPTAYRSELLHNDVPQPADLQPVRIGSRGAALEVSHLRIDRDIYYLATKYGFAMGDTISDFANGEDIRQPFPDGMDPTTALADPNVWQVYSRTNSVEFTLGPDQFFMLGDNSGASMDGRLWRGEYFVRRDLLIGKALFIYWPHSLTYIPHTPIPVYYFPNFWRMGLVR